MIEILTSALVLLGVFFALAGSVGLIRLPDVYCRLHAAGIVTALGVPLVLLAAVIFFSGVSATLSLKGLLAIIFLFLTSPVGTHMIGWSAYRSGVPLHRGSLVEETNSGPPEADTAPVVVAEREASSHGRAVDSPASTGLQ